MRKSSVLLLLANAIPLFGVLFWGWSLLIVMLGFWAETSVIGAFAILKMLTARGADRGISWPVRLFLVPFFCVHFGLFMAVHGVFVLVVSGAADRIDAGGFPLLVAPEMAWSTEAVRLFVLAVVLSHGFSFVTNYLRSGERQRLGPRQIMIQPYGRVVVQHVALLFGAFGTTLLGSSVPLLVLLVALKTGLDLKMHEREHRAPAAGLEPTPTE